VSAIGMTATQMLKFGLVVAAALIASAVGAWIVQRATRRAMQAWFAAALQGEVDRLGRELRQALEASADRALIQIGSRVAQLQDALTAHVTQITGVQAEQLGAYGRAIHQQLGEMTAAIQRHLTEMRTTLETRLQTLQQGNETRLEQMRATVEEKLQTTLEGKLGESFRLVSERLEQVHRGLGEMQALAAGVGDLKRVLGNVKSRGVFGEVQLAALLEQVLLPDQYAANVVTRPDSGERVDFAIRMPGRNGDATVWLPIDAKFPIEDYERLLAAQERADAAGA
jgi:DNA recombination protein RmuC